MDALASLLHSVHGDEALLGRTVMRPPWTIRFEDGAQLTLVAMLRGGGGVLAHGDAPVRLRHGDIAVVKGPEPFSLADDPGSRAPHVHVVCRPDECTTTNGERLDDAFRIGVRTCGEALDGPAALLTGSYRVKGRVSERLMGALPRALVLDVPHVSGPPASSDRRRSPREMIGRDPDLQAHITCPPLSARKCSFCETISAERDPAAGGGRRRDARHATGWLQSGELTDLSDLVLAEDPADEMPAHDRLSQGNVVRQLHNLMTYPGVRAADKDGRVRLIGMHFDATTGAVRFLEDMAPHGVTADSDPGEHRFVRRSHRPRLNAKARRTCRRDPASPSRDHRASRRIPGGRQRPQSREHVLALSRADRQRRQQPQRRRRSRRPVGSEPRTRRTLSRRVAFALVPRRRAFRLRCRELSRLFARESDGQRQPERSRRSICLAVGNEL